MARDEKIYILGCGAIGLALAAFLANAGKNVVAVRTRPGNHHAGDAAITVDGPGATLRIPVETTTLSNLRELNGVAIITAKSHANEMLAPALAQKAFAGPIVLLQNGIGIEAPFIESRFQRIQRAILYVTCQLVAENNVKFRPVASSPIGVLKGSEEELEACIEALATPGFPFHAERFIQKHIWKKTIINSVFNSICPLLRVDNGIFACDENAARLAREIVEECVPLAAAHDQLFTTEELMEQILRISKNSDGVLISTYQDILAGRETEIEFLNLALARLASALNPPPNLARTEFLGKLIAFMSASRMLISKG